MNIDEIRAEIPKAFTLDYEDTFQWALKNIKEKTEGIALYEVRQMVAEELVNMAYEAGITESGKKLYEKGYEEAAKDPKAWWVPDKNGGGVHISEYVKVDDCDVPMRVIGFSQDENGNMEFVDSEGFQISADECEKVIPDTRDKIKEELAESFIWDGEDITEKDVALKLAEKFISRIEALEYGGKYDIW